MFYKMYLKHQAGIYFFSDYLSGEIPGLLFRT